MPEEFAAELVDVRLLQTAKLLEWMLQNTAADAEAVGCALDAVQDARSSMAGIRAESVCS